MKTKSKSRTKNPKKARKYRVALTEAQIKRAIALADYNIQTEGHSYTSESLRYNLNCVYEKILESELGEKEKAGLASSTGATENP